MRALIARDNSRKPAAATVASLPSVADLTADSSKSVGTLALSPDGSATECEIKGWIDARELENRRANVRAGEAVCVGVKLTRKG